MEGRMVAGRLRRLLTAGIALGLGGSAPAALSPQASFAACLDYHCDLTRSVRVSQLRWQQVRALFAAVPDAAAEREAVRRSIALLEDQVGRLTGTWRDLAKNSAGAGLPGQLDCISESRNTTTYLQLLARDGLLRWHSVEEPVKRTRWLVMVHWTAVIRDRDSGQRYAVDAWFLDNGEPPYIQPLEHWLRGDDFADAR
jgi:hypothetical protein